MNRDAKLKRGAWLKTSDGYVYIYQGRRSAPSNTIILQDLGHTSCINKKGHRPIADWPDSYLEQLEEMKFGGAT